MQELDDATLLRAIAEGQQDGLLALYDRYNRMAFGLAYRILGDAALAEEVVQDAFLSIWNHARRFVFERGSARSWILTIVRNRALDQLRRRQSRPTFEPLDPAGRANPVQLDDEAVARLRGEEVRTAVANLPTDQRVVVELAYFEGLTHAEIAERLGIPLGTVKSRLWLGLAKLADALELGNKE